jgi:hypothetical protein
MKRRTSEKSFICNRLPRLWCYIFVIEVPSRMAKNQGGGEDRAKVKLRITDFELEGSNASVENSIRQIVQGLNARNAVVVQTKQFPA